jgi:hypothetical protein
MTAREKISIHPPLEGEWKFLRPPGHHPYAFDFVQMDEKRKSYHPENKLLFFVSHVASNRYFCWNKPVLAPVDGKVIRVGNGWQDHEYTNIWKAIQLWYNATFQFRPEEENGRLDIRPNAGNHVMIQAKGGYIVLLAHLRNQSIVVTEGQQVRQGEIVGLVGNSGNSTMPHLHVNLFDQMDNPFKAEVLPFVFSCYETLDGNGRWIESKSSLPRAGVFVRFNA